MSLKTVSKDVHDTLQSTPFRLIADAWRDYQKVYGGRRFADEVIGRADRFFLLVVLMGRHDALHPWLYERCREVEADPDGYLDLWAREHYKSTIITYAGSIQEIIMDPDISIGIFSHTRPTATKFLSQIKLELETNERLKATYPDVFFQNPKVESPKWSEEKGIVVKRTTNSKEATVEAWGLVDGQPVGSHFKLRIYDDVVTRESVSTPEQVTKTTDAHSLSSNLGARGPDGTMRAWHVGTRYSFADTYADIMERKALKPRLYPATKDGTADGEPVFLTAAGWAQKKIEQPMNILAAQMLVNPAAGNQALFQKENLTFGDVRPATLNIYILTDPASSRKKGNDRTAMYVIGVAQGMTKWLLDGYHHRMRLSERWANMKELRKRWMNMPGVQSVKVGYERYGSTADLEYFEEQMERDRDAWEIVELAWPRDGPGAKYDRIQRLEPDFRNRRFILPYDNRRKMEDGSIKEVMTSAQERVTRDSQAFRILKPTWRRDEDGNLYNLNAMFIQEYLVYPFSPHDDGLDVASRIYDIEATEPQIVDNADLEPEYS